MRHRLHAYGAEVRAVVIDRDGVPNVDRTRTAQLATVIRSIESDHATTATASTPLTRVAIFIVDDLDVACDEDMVLFEKFNKYIRSIERGMQDPLLGSGGIVEDWKSKSGKEWFLKSTILREEFKDVVLTEFDPDRIQQILVEAHPDLTRLSVQLQWDAGVLLLPPRPVLADEVHQCSETCAQPCTKTSRMTKQQLQLKCKQSMLANMAAVREAKKQAEAEAKKAAEEAAEEAERQRAEAAAKKEQEKVDKAIAIERRKQEREEEKKRQEEERQKKLDDAKKLEDELYGQQSVCVKAAVCAYIQSRTSIEALDRLDQENVTMGFTATTAKLFDFCKGKDGSATLTKRSVALLLVKVSCFWGWAW